MTDYKNESNRKHYMGFTESPFSLEMRKGRKGGILSVSDVVSVSDFSEERIELLSRGGRMCVTGERLVLSLFEDRAVEIYGKITGIEIQYGKVGRK